MFDLSKLRYISNESAFYFFYFQQTEFNRCKESDFNKSANSAIEWQTMNNVKKPSEQEKTQNGPLILTLAGYYEWLFLLFGWYFFSRIRLILICIVNYKIDINSVEIYSDRSDRIVFFHSK